MSWVTLVIPGFHGSGSEHWQTWLETRINNAQRVSGIDWDLPVLHHWVVAVCRAIQQSAHPVWLVAHSFGCLAAVTASMELNKKIAGMLLVAPADPDRFSPLGLRQSGVITDLGGIGAQLPKAPLCFPSIVVGSSNDPWMSMRKLCCWSEAWGSRLISIGKAGHINTEAGFGPWPDGLALLQSLQTSGAAFAAKFDDKRAEVIDR